MGCATNTVKVSSIIFNVLLAALAIGAIVWIGVNPQDFPQYLVIIVYIICSLVVLFALLGIFAAIRESICLLITCAVFLLILAILQIIAACFNQSYQNTRSGVDTVQYAWDHNKMDALQVQYECCGRDSIQDYVLLNRAIPTTCYVGRRSNNTQLPFLNGCIVKVQDYYDNESVRFAIVSWLLTAFELLGFLLAVFLAVNLRNKQRRLQF